MELTLKNFIRTYGGHITKLNIFNSTTNRHIRIDSCIDDIRNNGLEDAEILDWDIYDETIELIVTQEKSVVTDWIKV